MSSIEPTFGDQIKTGNKFFDFMEAAATWSGKDYIVVKKELYVDQFDREKINESSAIKTIKNIARVILFPLTLIALVFKAINRGRLSSMKKQKKIALDKIKNAKDLRCNMESYIPKNMKGDKDVGLAAVKGNGGLYNFLSETLKEDPDIALEAVAQNPYLFTGSLTENMKRRNEVIMAGVKKNAAVLSYVDGKDITEEIILQAIQTGYSSLKLMEAWEVDGVMKFYPIVIYSAPDGIIFDYAPPSLKSDPKVVMKAMKLDPRSYEVASEDAKDDPGLKALYESKVELQVEEIPGDDRSIPLKEPTVERR